MKHELTMSPTGRMNEFEIIINKKVFPLKNQSKEGKNLIFKDLKFTIKKGQFLSLFGPSGCGKTTLLNIISGLDKDYNGHIQPWSKKTFQKVNKEGISQKYSFSNISYMFQSPRLFPWLTTIENIKYPIKKQKNAEKVANDLLKKVGLEKYKNQYTNRLSGGMQRRVAMARAFAPNPNILLLDEPFISLDKKISNSLRKLLIQLWKKNKPIIIFVTHDLDEAIELADRIIFLSNLPSKIMLDYEINLARPRKQNSKKFMSLRRLLGASARLDRK
jgi:NitT/TauT family transport system ATP-binding protein